MEEGDTRKHVFTKANLHNLQILQNKVMRLIAKCGYETPVVELLGKIEFLSVNQIIAHTSLVTIFHVKKSGEPVYLANRLGFTQPLNQNIGGSRRQNINCVNFRLDRGREGLLYHGSKLWNLLDIHLKNETSIAAFKKKSRNCVLENFPALL